MSKGKVLIMVSLLIRGAVRYKCTFTLHYQVQCGRAARLPYTGREPVGRNIIPLFTVVRDAWPVRRKTYTATFPAFLYCLMTEAHVCVPKAAPESASAVVELQSDLLIASRAS